MGDLSDHFSRSEFDCHDGALAHPDPELVSRLETLRTLIGNKPIRIVSGYRTPAWNKRVGGARRSQHLYNRAADLERSLGVQLRQARAAGFRGIGIYKGVVVHVDVRPGGSVEFIDG